VHCIAALAVPPETLGSQPAANGRSVGRRTIGLATSVLGREGLAGMDILVSLRTSDSYGGPGAVHANQGRKVHGVSSDTLVRLASGLDALCVKKQCGLFVFWKTHDF
jgi:hypothetical protein